MAALLSAATAPLSMGSPADRPKATGYPRISAAACVGGPFADPGNFMAVSTYRILD